MTPHEFPALIRLPATTMSLPSADDLRGRSLIDCDGIILGVVGDLLLDARTHNISILEVACGDVLRLGPTKAYIPLPVIIAINPTEVRIGQSAAHVAAAPGYDPPLIEDPTFTRDIYAHYGITHP